MVRRDLGGGYLYTVMLTGIYVEIPQSTISSPKTWRERSSVTKSQQVSRQGLHGPKHVGESLAHVPACQHSSLTAAALMFTLPQRYGRKKHTSVPCALRTATSFLRTVLLFLGTCREMRKRVPGRGTKSQFSSGKESLLFPTGGVLSIRARIPVTLSITLCLPLRCKLLSTWIPHASHWVL